MLHQRIQTGILDNLGADSDLSLVALVDVGITVKLSVF
jgi:hypothetical protein